MTAAMTAGTLVSPTKKTKRRVGYGLPDQPSQIDITEQVIKRMRLERTRDYADE